MKTDCYECLGGESTGVMKQKADAFVPLLSLGEKMTEDWLGNLESTKIKNPFRQSNVSGKS